jgi:outer membrane protein assembly factor BamB
MGSNQATSIKTAEPAVVGDAAPALAWSTQVPVRGDPGPGFGSTLLHAGGKVLVAGGEGEVTALDVSSGEVAWQRVLGSGPSTLLAATEEWVIAATYAEVAGLELDSGAIMWSSLVGQDRRPAQGLLAGDALVVTLDTPREGDTRPPAILALDLPNGTTLWETELRGAGDEDLQWQGATLAGDRVLVQTTGGLYALSLEDGDQRWVHRFGDDRPELFNVTTPVVNGGLIVVLDPPGELVALGLARGVRRWTYQASTPLSGFAVLGNGLVAAAGEGLAVLGPEGRRRWGLGLSGAMVKGDGNALVAGEGRVASIEPDGTVLWEADQPLPTVTGVPIVSAGHLIVTAREGFASYDLASGSPEWKVPLVSLVAPPVAAEGVLLVADGVDLVSAYALDRPAVPRPLDRLWVVDGGVLFETVDRAYREWWPVSDVAVLGDDLYLRDGKRVDRLVDGQVVVSTNQPFNPSPTDSPIRARMVISSDGSRLDVLVEEGDSPLVAVFETAGMRRLTEVALFPCEGEAFLLRPDQPDQVLAVCAQPGMIFDYRYRADEEAGEAFNLAADAAIIGAISRAGTHYVLWSSGAVEEFRVPGGLQGPHEGLVGIGRVLVAATISQDGEELFLGSGPLRGGPADRLHAYALPAFDPLWEAEAPHPFRLLVTGKSGYLYGANPQPEPALVRFDPILGSGEAIGAGFVSDPTLVVPLD